MIGVTSRRMTGAFDPIDENEVEIIEEFLTEEVKWAPSDQKEHNLPYQNIDQTPVPITEDYEPDFQTVTEIHPFAENPIPHY
jgi:hypothetical protein